MDVRIYEDFLEVLKELPKKHADELLRGIINYVREWTEFHSKVRLSNVLRSSRVFRLDIQKWNKKGWENSKWGGRPVDKPTEKTSQLTAQKQLKNNEEEVEEEEEVEDKKTLRKKINKKKFLDFVFLSDEEFERLITDFWKEVIDSRIEDLDCWLSVPKNKSSREWDHNKTIRNWLKRDWIKKKSTKKLYDFDADRWEQKPPPKSWNHDRKKDLVLDE
jgi:hypothetical protein